MLDEAKKILKSHGYKTTTVKIIVGESEQEVRLEVFGGGIAMDDRIKKIKHLLPYYKVVRGSEDNIFITTAIQ